MEFNWIYDHRTPRKLRSALKMYGVSSSLLKVAIYHGGKMQINGVDKWAVDTVNYHDKVTLILLQKLLMIMWMSVRHLSILFMKIKTF